MTPIIDDPRKEEKPLTATMEDYLEAIFDLDKDKKVVRVRDIAKRLDVKMPTVTSMLRNLNNRGLVNYEKYEYVELTDSGADVGREMHRRHQVLYRFLTDVLKIDMRTANDEACRMEHVLSESSLTNLTDFMEFIQSCPRAGESWLRYFDAFRRIGHIPDNCRECSSQYPCELQEVEAREEA